ncbi:MAG: hypothetical protein ACHP65_07065 [Legionellales bacterium]
MPRVKGNGQIITADIGGDKAGRAIKIKFGNPNQIKTLVLLSIVGNEFCQGDYLKSIITESITTKKNMTFLIADEIYWYNLQDGSKSEVELKQQAVKLGETYFNEQLPYFLAPLEVTVADFNAQYSGSTTSEKISILNELILTKGLNYNIVGWHEWMNNAPQEYIVKKMQLKTICASNLELQRSIVEGAEGFAKRHHNHGSETYNLLKDRSIGYLTEESFGIMCLASLGGYNFIAYPGAIPEAFLITKKLLIKDMIVEDSDSYLRVNRPENFANLLEIYFNRSHPPKAAVSAKAEPYRAQFFKRAISSAEASNASSAEASNASSRRSSSTASSPDNSGSNTPSPQDPMTAPFNGVALAILSSKDMSEEQKQSMIAGVLTMYSSQQYPGKSNDDVVGPRTIGSLP